MPAGGVMSARATPISPLNSDCRITRSERLRLFIGYLVGKKSCEKTSVASRVSASDRPAHSTTLLYHLSPRPARKVSPEFQKVTGFSWGTRSGSRMNQGAGDASQHGNRQANRRLVAEGIIPGRHVPDCAGKL